MVDLNVEDLAIEYVDLDSILPYARNSNDHPPEQVALIAGSIAHFGWTYPPLVDTKGVLVAGHGRVLAAQQLGLKRVPTICKPHWTETQVKAYRLIDNQLARLATENTAMATLEVRDLELAGFEMPMLGFDDLTLQGMLAQAEEIDMPPLPDGDKSPFQQMAFKLHDDQAETVTRALASAHAMGDYDEELNVNRNANALERICQDFLERGARDGRG